MSFWTAQQSQAYKICRHRYHCVHYNLVPVIFFPIPFIACCLVALLNYYHKSNSTLGLKKKYCEAWILNCYLQCVTIEEQRLWITFQGHRHYEPTQKGLLDSLSINKFITQFSAILYLNECMINNDYLCLVNWLLTSGELIRNGNVRDFWVNFC